MTSPKYKVVLIGYGAMGFHHFRLLKSNSAVEIVAVVDHHRPILPGVKSLSNIEDVEIEEGWIAWIASPASTHADLVSKMLLKGMHVFVEKPLCLTTKLALELVECAETQRRLLFVGHSERYHPAFLRLLKQVRDFEPGEIQRISCCRMGTMPRSKVDCGVTLDLAVHDLDCIHAILGNQAPIRIKCEEIKTIPDSPWEEEIKAIMEYQKGVTVEIQVSRIRAEKERRISVWTKGMRFDADLLLPFSNASEEPLRLEQDEFFRILETEDWAFAKSRLESARLAVQTAEILTTRL